MNDEQPQGSDLIDDAIRQAEQQLEAKLEALRMSAMASENQAPQSGTGDVLEPTASAVPAAPQASNWEDAVLRRTDSDATEPKSSYVAEQEDSGFDSSFEPSPSGWSPTRSSAYESPYRSHVVQVPSEDEQEFWSQTRTSLRQLQQTTDTMASSVSANITDSIERIVREELGGPSASLRQLHHQLPVITDRLERAVAEEIEAPTALLQQLHEEMPTQLDRLERNIKSNLQRDIAHIEQSVADNVSRLTEGISSMVDNAGQEYGAGMAETQRIVTANSETVQHQLSTGLSNVSQQVETEANQTRQILGTATDQIQGRLISSTEQIQANIDAEANHTRQIVSTSTEQVQAAIENAGNRVESSVILSSERLSSTFSETLEQFDRETRMAFDRLTETVQSEVARPEAKLRMLQDELPQRFGKLERVIEDHDPASAIEHLQHGITDLRKLQRTVADSLGDTLRTQIEEVSKIQGQTLEQVTSITMGLERDRIQRVEDLEQMIDAISNGWQSAYVAMNKLLKRVETFDSRMARVEKRMDAIATLERTVDEALTGVREQLGSHLTQMGRSIADLQPAPVVVTVNHPEAQVSNTTRGGMLGGAGTTAQ